MTLVEDAKRAWRWVSMQCMAAGSALLASWDLIPDDLKAKFSESHVRWVAIALLVMGMVGRLVKQGEK